MHRKILDNPISTNPAWLSVWIHLLLLANHDESDSFIWNGERTFLKVGQVLTGRKKLAHITGVSETTIERVLQYLEAHEKIGQQKTTKYRVITILKWKEYQITDSKKTTDGQQTDTFKKLRNKEVKNNTDTEEATSPKIVTPSEKARWFFTTMEQRPLPPEGIEYMQRFVERTGISKELAWHEVLKFVAYWTEHTKNGQKELWETKKTFEVDRRLTTWFGNVRSRSVRPVRGKEIIM